MTDRCEQLQERITEYLYGELEAAERDQFQEHLERCADCRAELTALRQTLELLEREPEFVIPAHIERDFTQGVYRRIAAERYPLEGMATRSSWWQRWFTLPRVRWAMIPAMMAVSLAMGIWIGSTRTQPAEAPQMADALALPQQSAQERLEQYWQEEMRWGLEEAHVEQYLRNDPMSALEQYARVGELGAGGPELLVQVQADRRELMRRAGI